MIQLAPASKVIFFGLVLFLIPAAARAATSDLWPQGVDLQRLDHMMLVPENMTRVIGVDLPQHYFQGIDEQAVEHLLRDARDQVMATAKANGYSDILFWTYNISISQMQATTTDTRFYTSGSISFLVTGRGDDEGLAKLISKLGYTARITPYVFSKCGIPNPTFQTTNIQTR